MYELFLARKSPRGFYTGGLPIGYRGNLFTIVSIRNYSKIVPLRKDLEDARTFIRI